jgi:glycosyltransferase involved in cell wall biosynthesis
MKDVVIVIPSLNPTTHLLKLLETIRFEQPDINIVTVNDGSIPDSDEIFKQAKENYYSEVLSHSKNKGKGAALKTAFQFILDQLPDVQFVVTMDADGQHQYTDMMKCVKSARHHPESLILGARQFDENVPFRSKFGNLLTRNIFRLTTGTKLSDTQTGLRVIPRHFLEPFLNVDGNRFDYEMNMLMETKNRQWTIHSEPIRTVYIEGNTGSSFRVIRDSITIYWVFAKYVLSSIASFLVDVTAYAVLIRLLANTTLSSIMVSSVLARVISSVFNYFVNREIVFKGRSNYSFFKYFGLVVLQITASGFLVYAIHLVLPFINTVFIKIVVDSFLFLVSFYVQKKFIFGKRKHSLPDK